MGAVVEVQVSRNGARALLRFDTPVEYRGATYAFAVASARLGGQEVGNMVAGTSISASLIGISRQQAESPDPFDTSAWRGGLAFIGDIKRIA